LQNTENNSFVYSIPPTSNQKEPQINIEKALSLLSKLNISQIFSPTPTRKPIAPKFDNRKLLNMEKRLKKHESIISSLRKS